MFSIFFVFTCEYNEWLLVILSEPTLDFLDLLYSKYYISVWLELQQSIKYTEILYLRKSSYWIRKQPQFEPGDNWFFKLNCRKLLELFSALNLFYLLFLLQEDKTLTVLLQYFLFRVICF